MLYYYDDEQSPLITALIAMAETVQFLKADFPLCVPSHTLISLSNNLLSGLAGLGLVEGAFISATALFGKKSEDNTPLTRLTAFIKGGTLLTLSGCHMPALGYAIKNTIELFEILVKCCNGKSDRRLKVDPLTMIAKLMEVAGWWLLFVSSLSASPVAIGIAALCLTTAVICKMCQCGKSKSHSGVRNFYSEEKPRGGKLTATKATARASL
jgi:hypothetical protein